MWESAWNPKLRARNTRNKSRETLDVIREWARAEQGIRSARSVSVVSVDFSHLFDGSRTRSVLAFDLQIGGERDGRGEPIVDASERGFLAGAPRGVEAYQRQYCDAEGIPLKAFGDWRTKFKAQPQPERKLPASRPKSQS
jgi:hypothetical protein